MTGCSIFRNLLLPACLVLNVKVHKVLHQQVGNGAACLAGRCAGSCMALPVW